MVDSEGVESDEPLVELTERAVKFIPWAAMKSVWRSGSGICLNCSGQMLVVNFGLRQVGMFNRAGFVEHVCGDCRRLYRDSVGDVSGWMLANLDVEVRPSFEMVWGKRVKLEAIS